MSIFSGFYGEKADIFGQGDTVVSINKTPSQIPKTFASSGDIRTITLKRMK